MALPLLIGITWLLNNPELLAVVNGARYGELKVIGNTDTPRRVILSMIDIQPGQRIELGKRRPALKKLRECSTLRCDPGKGELPAIEFDPNPGSVYLDVVIKVYDTPGTWLGYEVVDVCRYAARAFLFRDWLAGVAAQNTVGYIVDRVNR